jgi:hypothetical protein
MFPLPLHNSARWFFPVLLQTGSGIAILASARQSHSRKTRSSQGAAELVGRRKSTAVIASVVMNLRLWLKSFFRPPRKNVQTAGMSPCDPPVRSKELPYQETPHRGTPKPTKRVKRRPRKLHTREDASGPQRAKQHFSKASSLEESYKAAIEELLNKARLKAREFPQKDIDVIRSVFSSDSWCGLSAPLKATTLDGLLGALNEWATLVARRTGFRDFQITSYVDANRKDGGWLYFEAYDGKGMLTFRVMTGPDGWYYWH